MTGNQGNQWYFGKVSLTPGRYVLRFEGYVGNGNQGDIAIDDFAIYNRSCSAFTQAVSETGASAIYGYIYNMTGEFPHHIGDLPGHGTYTMKERICYGKGKSHHNEMEGKDDMDMDDGMYQCRMEDMEDMMGMQQNGMSTMNNMMMPMPSPMSSPHMMMMTMMMMTMMNPQAMHQQQTLHIHMKTQEVKQFVQHLHMTVEMMMEEDWKSLGSDMQQCIKDAKHHYMAMNEGMENDDMNMMDGGMKTDMMGPYMMTDPYTMMYHQVMHIDTQMQEMEMKMGKYKKMKEWCMEEMEMMARKPSPECMNKDLTGKSCHCGWFC